jgi:hypothetical protein
MDDRTDAVSDELPTNTIHRPNASSSPFVENAYRYVLEFLASNPPPEQVAAFCPTEEMTARLRFLVDKERDGEATIEETVELDDYMHLEHLVVMAKIQTLSENKELIG